MDNTTGVPFSDDLEVRKQEVLREAEEVERLQVGYMKYLKKRDRKRYKLIKFIEKIGCGY